MKKYIFREEALKHQSQRWVGKALLLSGIPYWFVTASAALFIIVICVFLFSFSYTRRVSVPGEIVTLPHAINVYSPIQGYVINAHVKVGDVISTGDILYEINSSRDTSSGTVGEAAKISIENQMRNINSIIANIRNNRQATIDNLNKQISEYTSSISDIKNLLESAKNGVTQLNKNSKEYENYQKRGLITRDQLTNQRYMFYQQQSLYQSLNNQKKQTLLQLEQARSELMTRSADFDSKIAENEYQLSELRRKLVESEAGDITLVKAQSSGKVQSMSVTPGQMVKSGSSLLQMTPLGKVKNYFLMWLPDSSVPYLKKNDAINISYSAFPADKFGMFKGVIEQISYTPASREELSEYGNMSSTSNSGVENYYKVMASIKNVDVSDKGKKLSISNGLKGNAMVFLETQPLYKWMFAPVYNIKNSIIGNENES